MSDARWLSLSAILAVLGCSSGDCDLVDDLRLFAGDSAIDCGTAATDEQRVDVDECARSAFEAGSAFLARYEAMGTDSKVVRAAAMNTAGVLKLFLWDSSPCGGGACDPVTDQQTCEEPSLVQESREDFLLPFDCKTFGLTQRVCG